MKMQNTVAKNKHDTAAPWGIFQVKQHSWETCNKLFGAKTQRITLRPNSGPLSQQQI